MMKIHIPNREILKRIFSSILLLSYTFYIFFKGEPIWITVSALCIQLKCFNEVVSVAYNISGRSSGLRNFRLIAWYLLTVTNYFLFCEILADNYDIFIRKIELVYTLVYYHRIIAFCFYLFGLFIFVCSFVRNRVNQFKFLAFVHVLLILIASPPYVASENAFHGLVWILLMCLLVTINDVSAYVFGKLLGKTPLIEVSPTKTWEGYIGGGISTIIFGPILSHILCGSDHLVCPIEYMETLNGIEINKECTRDNLFVLQKYNLGIFSLSTYPFLSHSFILSVFASIIGPFGGFFASGFKRTYKVKHFGNIIPGHGGIMDRFDCFYLMAIFVHVYINAFVKTETVEKIYQKFLYMDTEKQIQFYSLLKKSLESGYVLNDKVLR